MPYQSDRQRRFMHARHPGIAARWDEEIRQARKRRVGKADGDDRARGRRGDGRYLVGTGLATTAAAGGYGAVQGNRLYRRGQAMLDGPDLKTGSWTERARRLKTAYDTGAVQTEQGRALLTTGRRVGARAGAGLVAGGLLTTAGMVRGASNASYNQGLHAGRKIERRRWRDKQKREAEVGKSLSWGEGSAVGRNFAKAAGTMTPLARRAPAAASGARPAGPTSRPAGPQSRPAGPVAMRPVRTMPSQRPMAGQAAMPTIKPVRPMGVAKAEDWQTIEQRELKARRARRQQGYGMAAASAGAGIAGGAYRMADDPTRANARMAARGVATGKLPIDLSSMGLGQQTLKVNRSGTFMNALKGKGGREIQAMALGSGMVGGGLGWALGQRGREAYQQHHINERRRGNAARRRGVEKAYRPYDPEEDRRHRLGVYTGALGLGGVALAGRGARGVVRNTRSIRSAAGQLKNTQMPKGGRPVRRPQPGADVKGDDLKNFKPSAEQWEQAYRDAKPAQMSDAQRRAFETLSHRGPWAVRARDLGQIGAGGAAVGGAVYSNRRAKDRSWR